MRFKLPQATQTARRAEFGPRALSVTHVVCDDNLRVVKFVSWVTDWFG